MTYFVYMVQEGVISYMEVLHLKKRIENTIEAFSFEIMSVAGCTCRHCNCGEGYEDADAVGGIEQSSGSPK